MPHIDRAPSPIIIKIVYYGPSGIGKTATLRRLSARLHNRPGCRMLSLSGPDERTLYFDSLPIPFSVGDTRVLLRLYSVPGQPMHRHTRRLLLRSADGVILVGRSWSQGRDAAGTDSGTTAAQGGTDLDNAALCELRSNLRECGITVESLPVVVQPSPHDSADDASMLQALLSIVQAAWPAAAARAEGRSPAAALIMAALRQALGVSGAGHTAADGTAVAGTGDDAELMRVPCGPQPLAELWSQRARSGIPSGGVPRS